MASWALPRTRGFTRQGRNHARRHPGSPTHAWVHPILTGSGRANCGLSHARVGSPSRDAARCADRAALPRTRGFTAEIGVVRTRNHGSPTHAWVHRPALRCGPLLEGLSHARVVPRTRGFTYPGPDELAGPLGSPTHAWVHRRQFAARQLLHWLSHARVGSPAITPNGATATMTDDTLLLFDLVRGGFRGAFPGLAPCFCGRDRQRRASGDLALTGASFNQVLALVRRSTASPRGIGVLAGRLFYPRLLDFHWTQRSAASRRLVQMAVAMRA
jgi:hypothetical protein